MWVWKLGSLSGEYANLWNISFEDQVVSFSLSDKEKRVSGVRNGKKKASDVLSFIMEGIKNHWESCWENSFPSEDKPCLPQEVNLSQ